MVVRESFVIKYWGKMKDDYLFSAFNLHIASSKNLTSFSFCWEKYLFLLLYIYLYYIIYISIYFTLLIYIIYIYIYIYYIYIYIYLIYFYFEKVFTVIYLKSLAHAFICTQIDLTIDLTIDFTTGCSQQ